LPLAKQTERPYRGPVAERTCVCWMCACLRQCGLDFLRWLGDNADPTPTVMIPGHGTIRDATRRGAFDFLEKPLARDRVLLVVNNALDRLDLQHENQRFGELGGDAPRMTGDSVLFLRAVTAATQVARSDVGVLPTGESGSGKELFAEHIHRQSPFASRAFVEVNCAAIPSEFIESELFGHEKGTFTGAAGVRLKPAELCIDVGRPDDYRRVEASVWAGELKAASFRMSKGGLFWSLDWRGDGAYRLRAKLKAGELHLYSKSDEVISRSP